MNNYPRNLFSLADRKVFFFFFLAKMFERKFQKKQENKTKSPGKNCFHKNIADYFPTFEKSENISGNFFLNIKKFFSILFLHLGFLFHR